MRQSAALCNGIRSIHAEEGKHQDNLSHQNNVGIEGGPALQVLGGQSGQCHAISSDEEHYACDDYACR